MSVPNIYFGSGAYTPVWVSDIFCQLIFRLAFKLGFRTLVRDYSDSLFGVFLESSTESLILAQDERWRRA